MWFWSQMSALCHTTAITDGAYRRLQFKSRLVTTPSGSFTVRRRWKSCLADVFVAFVDEYISMASRQDGNCGWAF